jgi:F-type H+-transporting ATPase subunit gamma
MSCAIADTEKPIKSNSSLLAVCDKSKMQLSHVLGKNLAMSFNQIGHDIPNIIDTVIAGKSAGF